MEHLSPIEQEHEVQEYQAKMLGSLGLYSAELDLYPTLEHPEDDQWIVKGNN